MYSEDQIFVRERDVSVKYWEQALYKSGSKQAWSVNTRWNNQTVVGLKILVRIKSSEKETFGKNVTPDNPHFGCLNTLFFL